MKKISKALLLQFFKSLVLKKWFANKHLCHKCLIYIYTVFLSVSSSNINNNNVQPRHRIHTPMNILTTRFRPLSFVYGHDVKHKHPTGHNEATNGICKLCFQRQ